MAPSRVNANDTLVLKVKIQDKIDIGQYIIQNHRLLKFSQI